VICRQDFDFTAGQTAVILHHVAYGYDFVHPGACEAAALGSIFPEPGYDCAAFAHDPERRAVVSIAPGAERQRVWALIEYRDGSRRFEGVLRDAEWQDEPGGAEFPQSRADWALAMGYAPPVDFATSRHPSERAA